MRNLLKITALLFSTILIISCNNTIETSKKDYQPVVKDDAAKHLKDNNLDPELKQKLEDLIAMMDEHPKSAKLYAERANLFVMMGKTMQALQDITMAVDLDPKNSDFHTNKGQLLRQFKRNKEALEEVEKAIELDSESVGAHFNRGALFFNINRFEKAMKDFTFCIKARPEVGPPYFNRAFTYEQLHDIESAKKDLQEFIKISQNKEWKKIAHEKLQEWDRVDYKIIIKDKDRLESMGM